MDGIQSQLAALPGLTPWLLGITLIISALGFYRVVYFVSIGYAFSIVAMAIVTAIALAGNLALPAALQLGLLVAWGLRLGFYLVVRERQTAYRRQLEGNQSYDRRVSRPKRIPIWISVALLYVAMFSPALFAAAAARPLAGFPLVIQVAGLLVMALGLALEAVADAQKSAAKTTCATCFTNVGLYRWVRCPNYLGEITFWTGSLIAGAAFLASALQVVLALIGWACIVLIMLGSTKRLERTQAARYGEQPAYQEYVRTVAGAVPVGAGVHAAGRQGVPGVAGRPFPSCLNALTASPRTAHCRIGDGITNLNLDRQCDACENCVPVPRLLDPGSDQDFH